MPSETLNSHFKPLNSPKQFHLPPPPDHPNRLQSMLCSVPTTTKSSKWLQRLRSSRGFPESDHIDLEHFLSTSSLEKIDPTDYIPFRKRHPPVEHFVAEKRDDDDDNNNNNNNNTNNNNNNNNNNNDDDDDDDDVDDNGAVQGRDLINNVLSDLFHMGECEDRSRIKRKKSCRKQQCPRIYEVSTNLGVPKVAARKDRISSSRHRVKEINEVTERVEEEEEKEKEKAHRDLSAYSQTEVTVIDTSVPCWKFDKMLYRCKNIWKVGDRKGKGLMSGDRKKRKERLSETGGDVQKKKLKKLKKKLKLCSSSKCADKGEFMVPSKSDQGYEQGKMVAGSERKRDNCSQVHEKSFGKKQIDEGSSVILIKSIPTTNKKNVSGISNSCVKSMQR